MWHCLDCGHTEAEWFDRCPKCRSVAIDDSPHGFTAGISIHDSVRVILRDKNGVIKQIA